MKKKTALIITLSIIYLYIFATETELDFSPNDYNKAIDLTVFIIAFILLATCIYIDIFLKKINND